MSFSPSWFAQATSTSNEPRKRKQKRKRKKISWALAAHMPQMLAYEGLKKKKETLSRHMTRSVVCWGLNQEKKIQKTSNHRPKSIFSPHLVPI